MSRFKWLTCPRNDLSIWRPMECQVVPDAYLPRTFTSAELRTELPGAVVGALAALGRHLPAGWAARAAGLSFTAIPMQLHAVMLALFASVIAPFGGFFASGVKRGFKVKDFGHSIPGHGGMTDRMDCQVGGWWCWWCWWWGAFGGCGEAQRSFASLG